MIRTPLDPFFTFALGQEVTLAGMLTRFQWLPNHDEEAQVPQKLIIVERQITECHGGHQQSYHCRVLTAGGLRDSTSFTDKLFWLQEPELVPYPHRTEKTP